MAPFPAPHSSLNDLIDFTETLLNADAHDGTPFPVIYGISLVLTNGERIETKTFDIRPKLSGILNEFKQKRDVDAEKAARTHAWAQEFKTMDQALQEHCKMLDGLSSCDENFPSLGFADATEKIKHYIPGKNIFRVEIRFQ